MSQKKRFDQIEISNLSAKTPPSKVSLLNKFSFKRKLELNGIAKESASPEKSKSPPQVKHPAALRSNLNKNQPGPTPISPKIEGITKLAPLSDTEVRILEDAHERAEAAKLKIIIALVAIPLLCYVIYHLIQAEGTGGRGTAQIIGLVLALMFGEYGRRRWWER